MWEEGRRAAVASSSPTKEPDGDWALAVAVAGVAVVEQIPASPTDDDAVGEESTPYLQQQ